MRSTRGKSRARIAAAKQHYTPGARVTSPLHSNTPSESRKGITRARGDWTRNVNTNTPLAKGGVSSFYRAREGYGS
jgi:hypothetical protein